MVHDRLEDQRECSTVDDASLGLWFVLHIPIMPEVKLRLPVFKLCTEHENLVMKPVHIGNNVTPPIAVPTSAAGCPPRDLADTGSSSTLRRRSLSACV